MTGPSYLSTEAITPAADSIPEKGSDSVPGPAISIMGPISSANSARYRPLEPDDS